MWPEVTKKIWYDPVGSKVIGGVMGGVILMIVAGFTAVITGWFSITDLTVASYTNFANFLKSIGEDHLDALIGTSLLFLSWLPVLMVGRNCIPAIQLSLKNIFLMN